MLLNELCLRITLDFIPVQYLNLIVKQKQNLCRRAKFWTVSWFRIFFRIMSMQSNKCFLYFCNTETVVIQFLMKKQEENWKLLQMLNRYEEIGCSSSHAPELLCLKKIERNWKLLKDPINPPLCTMGK